MPKMNNLIKLELSPEEVKTLKKVFDDAERCALLSDERDFYRQYYLLHKNIHFQVAEQKGLIRPSKMNAEK
jgi:hypothetical protein